MAFSSLQLDSARANPEPLTLMCAGNSFDNIANSIDDASGLAFLLSRADEMEPNESKAFRALSDLLDAIRDNALAEGVKFHEAHHDQKIGDAIGRFPGPGAVTRTAPR